jgi:hypothetical protein
MDEIDSIVNKEEEEEEEENMVNNVDPNNPVWDNNNELIMIDGIKSIDSYLKSKNNKTVNVLENDLSVDDLIKLSNNETVNVMNNKKTENEIKKEKVINLIEKLQITFSPRFIKPKEKLEHLSIEKKDNLDLEEEFFNQFGDHSLIKWKDSDEDFLKTAEKEIKRKSYGLKYIVEELNFTFNNFKYDQISFLRFFDKLLLFLLKGGFPALKNVDNDFYDDVYKGIEDIEECLGNDINLWCDVGLLIIKLIISDHMDTLTYVVETVKKIKKTNLFLTLYSLPSSNDITYIDKKDASKWRDSVLVPNTIKIKETDEWLENVSYGDKDDYENDNEEGYVSDLVGFDKTLGSYKTKEEIPLPRFSSNVKLDGNNVIWTPESKDNLIATRFNDIFKNDEKNNEVGIKITENDVHLSDSESNSDSSEDLNDVKEILKLKKKRGDYLNPYEKELLQMENMRTNLKKYKEKHPNSHQKHLINSMIKNPEFFVSRAINPYLYSLKKINPLIGNDNFIKNVIKDKVMDNTIEIKRKYKQPLTSQEKTHLKKSLIRTALNDGENPTDKAYEKIKEIKKKPFSELNFFTSLPMINKKNGINLLTKSLSKVNDSEEDDDIYDYINKSEHHKKRKYHHKRTNKKKKINKSGRRKKNKK